MQGPIEKDSLYVMVMQRKKIAPENISKLPPQFRVRCNGMSNTPLPIPRDDNGKIIPVKIKNMDTMDKLVEYIYVTYGYGRFIVMFRGMVPNKSFKPCQDCVKRYGYSTTGRLRVHTIHKKKYCQKKRHNWVKRLEVDIYPDMWSNPEMKFKILDNRMHKLKWFFKS